MRSEDAMSRNPIVAITATVRGGLEPGQVGGVLARAGVGKSAFLVHVALRSLVRGVNVLHISLNDTKSHVRSTYNELFSQAVGAEQDTTANRVTMERHRVIHACLGRAFSPDDLVRLVEMLGDVMEFHPQLVIVDGLTAQSIGAVDGWEAAARGHNLRVWAALRLDDNEDASQIATLFSTAISLSHGKEDVLLQTLRANNEASTAPPVRLDPLTMLLRPDDIQHASPAPPSPPAGLCTMYSGGAMGAEACFGETAAHWGVKEVNFTFPGHNQKRSTGRQELSERELDAGTVSLTYVSHRLHRHWEKTPMLRKVLQTLWHVVSHADQVFVIGEIMEDGTVQGGTGWSVELARRWHKPIWVFDQAREAWFQWDGADWNEGLPVIESVRIAGSGTRFLSPAGEAAIADLFVRSFGTQD